MKKTHFFSILLMLFFSSCKVSESEIIGSYRIHRFPKTTLKINSDRTFEFSKNHSNPYLHPLDHPEDYFFDTKGTWQILDKRTISLTSQSDTLVYPLAFVEERPAKAEKLSCFTFFDIHGDTVNVLYVKYVDGSIIAKMHRSMSYFSEDLVKHDTLEFHFYGYRPYFFVNGHKVNQDYTVTLKPAFQPNFFQGDQFKIQRNRLVNQTGKYKFKKIKIGK